jgi:hypothetical protein
LAARDKSEAVERSFNEGNIDGNTITFKIKSPGGDITMTFTGRINGDEIVFTREVSRKHAASSSGRRRSWTLTPPESWSIFNLL